jgi:hypothetical protein
MTMMGEAPMVWCSVLGGGKIETWLSGGGDWSKLRWYFYNSEWWESGGPENMVGNGGADSIFWFWLESGGDMIKRCRKMKWRQRAHLNSIERKHDTTQQHDDIGRRRCGTGDAKEKRQRQLGWRKSIGPKNKEISYGRFNCYK